MTSEDQLPTSTSMPFSSLAASSYIVSVGDIPCTKSNRTSWVLLNAGKLSV